MNNVQFSIPNGIEPNSIDPLKIDQFNNFFPGQMIYTQPLTVSMRGELSSELLSAFSYNEQTHEILLEMKETPPLFSDGFPVSADDVAFAIARLAFARPKFPVLRFIEGLEDWIESENALESYPKGIKVHGRQIRIQLSRHQLNPLFRLTLNVVSVIPKRCIDLNTNTLKCSEVPGSGYYVRENGDAVSFAKRDSASSKLPDRILFDYPKAKNVLEYLKNMDERSVAFLHDLDVSPAEYAEISNQYQMFRLAESWFSGFLLNPQLKPFTDRDFRRWFLQELHTVIESQSFGPTVYAKSLFPEIVPGYIPNSEFKKYEFDSNAIARFKNELKGFEFNWAIRKAKPPEALAFALNSLAQKYSFKLNAPIVAESSHSGWDSYSNKEVALQTSHSGFWPLDPIGDIQMLFTPNLHQDYKDIWKDETFNRLMLNLAQSSNLEIAKSSMLAINKYLYEDAKFSIFAHHGYFYVRKKVQGPFVEPGLVSLTVPYPWQVFNAQND